VRSPTPVKCATAVSSFILTKNALSAAPPDPPRPKRAKRLDLVRSPIPPSSSHYGVCCPDCDATQGASLSLSLSLPFFDTAIRFCSTFCAPFLLLARASERRRRHCLLVFRASPVDGRFAKKKIWTRTYRIAIVWTYCCS
jgi:hypothetical protein